MKFGVAGTLAFLFLFIYLYKNSGEFRKSIGTAFVIVTFYFSSPEPVKAIKDADAFSVPQHRSRGGNRGGLFGSQSSNDGSGSGNPNDGGSGGNDLPSPQFQTPESVGTTKKLFDDIDPYLNNLEELSDTETEDEKECPVESVNTNTADHAKPITFFDGFEAKSIKSATEHQVVKHGHSWGINDIDLTWTEEANKSSAGGQFKQIRTKLTPENVEKFQTNLGKFASNPNLEVYSDYPINNGIGRGYLDPKTGMFVGVDENDIIRKAYPASENLINYLRTNCHREN